MVESYDQTTLWQMILDPCFGKNCNHGSCVVNDGGEPECHCNTGWTGEDCNVPDDIVPTTLQP